MNNSNNNSEIKKFLLKHKQEFKNNRNGNKSVLCFICPLRKAKEELHYGEMTCLEIYKDIIASFGKKPIDPSTCAQAFSEIVRIGFKKNYIIKNE
jgi:hypothetical protein